MATLKKSIPVPAPAPAPVVEVNSLTKLLAISRQIAELKADINNLEEQLADLETESQTLLAECGEDLKAELTELSNLINPQQAKTKGTRTRTPGKVNPDIVAELQELFSDEEVVELSEEIKTELVKRYKCEAKDVTASMEHIAERQLSGSQGRTRLFKLKAQSE